MTEIEEYIKSFALTGIRTINAIKVKCKLFLPSDSELTEDHFNVVAKCGAIGFKDAYNFGPKCSQLLAEALLKYGYIDKKSDWFGKIECPHCKKII